MDELSEILGPLLSPRRYERLVAALDGRVGRVRVVTENVRQKHNLSAILRSADAFGVQGLHLVEESDDVKITRRVTMGCHKWLTLRLHRDFASCAEKLRSEGYALWAATLTSRSVELSQIPLNRPVALVFGNELTGVSDAALAHCEGEFTIPMCGFVQSLNVSVAAAVTLHDVVNRLRSEFPDSWGLNPDEKAELLARWLPKSAPFAKRVARAFSQRGQTPQPRRVEPSSPWRGLPPQAENAASAEAPPQDPSAPLLCEDNTP